MTEQPQSNTELLENEISLKDLLFKIKEWIDYLKTKWLVIVLTGILGACIGLVYASFQKTIYTASLTFALEDEKTGGGGFSGAMGLASSLGIDLGSNAGGAFSGANLIELMKSRTIIEKVLLNGINKNGKTYSLADYYLNFSGERETLSKKQNLAKIHYLVGEDRIGYSMQKDSVLGTIFEKFVGTEGALTVSQKDKKISIISVEVKTRDEFFSKVLVEAVVKEVSEFYINTKSKKARNNVAILQKQADSIKNELNNAISGVAEASDNTFNLNPALNIKRTPSTRKQVDVQANTAILTQLVTNLEMAKVALLKETPLIQIIDTPILPLKKDKISKSKSSIVGGGIAIFFLIVYLIIKSFFLEGLKNNSKIGI